MLHTDLVKIIKKYLNSTSSLLDALIIQINHFSRFYFGTIRSIKTKFDNFNINEEHYNTNSASIIVENENCYHFTFAKLKVTNVGNVDQHFIKNLITTHLTILNCPYGINNKDLVRHVMHINQILYKYGFNNFLVLLYIKNNINIEQILVRWSNTLMKS